MSFRRDFCWGVATSSYQIEGACREDGKGESIWDKFVHDNQAASYVPNNGGGFDTSGRIWNHDTGDIACDDYHRYKEDVALMKQLGVKAYRFSISWPRVLPEGVGAINEKGLRFYSDLVDELLKAGIEPFVTLFHWDLPQTLEEKGGWLNSDSPKWFEKYARIVVKRLSDRVTHWITLNEPQCVVNLGYGTKVHAPGRDTTEKERFLIAHRILLAHGLVVKAIRAHSVKPCSVGIALNPFCAIPTDDTPQNVETAKQVFYACHPAMGLWSNSWWFDPIYLGSYPESGMQAYRENLPDIAQNDLATIHQPLDFLGINLYQGIPVAYNPDTLVEFAKSKPGFAMTSLQWRITPRVLYYVPKFLYDKYQIPIYITENGMTNLDWVHLDGKVHDPQRIDFLNRYLRELKHAAEDGVDLRGYFHWSLMDNFEWNNGYAPRFGLVYVDYSSQRRIIKDSGYWYRQCIASNGDNL